MTPDDVDDLPEQSAPDCSCCGAEGEGVHWLEVQQEDTGELIDVDLCDDCLEITRRYNRGEDVEWPTNTDEAAEDGGSA